MFVDEEKSLDKMKKEVLESDLPASTKEELLKRLKNSIDENLEEDEIVLMEGN